MLCIQLQPALSQTMPPLLAISPIDTSARYHSPASPTGRPHNRTPSSLASSAPTEIIPRLYVSDLAAAENPNVLRQLGITHIVSAMHGNVAYPSNFPPQCCMQVQLADSPFAELAAHLPHATAFIQSALQDPRARVLVHCVQGVSRSPSIVCAYLIRAYGWTPAQAVQYVKSKRPTADPNPGFIQQLGEFANSLRSGTAGRR